MDQQAIKAALLGNWASAVKLNKTILKEDKNDLEALGRLAYAYAKCGNFKKACSTYKKLLKLDPINPIARKNFSRYKEAGQCKQLQNAVDCQKKLSPSLFLSETAKAKSVDLINIASKNILLNLVVGEEVIVQRKRFDLRVVDKNGLYIGKFPDDVGRSLMSVFENNEKVQFFLKDVEENQITVFVKWV